MKPLLDVEYMRKTGIPSPSQQGKHQRLVCHILRIDPHILHFLLIASLEVATVPVKL